MVVQPGWAGGSAHVPSGAGRRVEKHWLPRMRQEGRESPQQSASSRNQLRQEPGGPGHSHPMPHALAACHPPPRLQRLPATTHSPLQGKKEEFRRIRDFVDCAYRQDPR